MSISSTKQTNNRPPLSGNLSGDRETSAWNPTDLNLMLLQAASYSCTAPRLLPLDASGVEFTPVDWVAQVVVECCLPAMVCSALGKVYHVINPQPIATRFIIYHFLGYCTESWNALLYEIRCISSFSLLSVNYISILNHCNSFYYDIRFLFIFVFYILSINDAHNYHVFL